MSRVQASHECSCSATPSLHDALNAQVCTSALMPHRRESRPCGSYRSNEEPQPAHLR
jgi:hypothetical protein